MNANIAEFVNKHKSNDVEIECRFNEGKIGVSYDTFQNVYSKLCEKKEFTKARILRTQVYGMKHKTSQQEFRFTQFENKPGILETKNRIGIQDVKDFNYKIVASKEIVKNETNTGLKSNYIVTNIRQKERTSFFNDKVSIDLTNVLQNNSQRIYEIECELKNPISNINYFENTILMLLKYIQRSNIVVSNSEKNKLLQSYATLCGEKIPKFIGPLPYTISKNQFDNDILSCNYAVTDKADGLRKLLYIDKKGEALLIGRRNGLDLIFTTIYIGSGFIQMKNSLYDGELVGSVYYIFDCMFVDGKNVQHENLLDRLSNVKLSRSQGASISSPNASIGFRLKTFYYQNEKIIGVDKFRLEDSSIYDHAYNLWNKRSNLKYTLDGLIFTPVYASYYNDKIFKWKPTDTIDFFVRKSSKTSTTETWTLHIAGFDKAGNYQHFGFRGIDGRGSFNYKKGKSILYTTNRIPPKFGTVSVANNIAEKFRDNTVIEFKFHKGRQIFIPIQTREDKKFGNGILAVNDAYESIQNPITSNLLKNGKYVYCGRKYHNAIKNHLIQKYVKRSDVLDIGVGAGGNIRKYQQANVKSLVGIDIVPVQYAHNNKMTFYHIKNTNFYNISNILKNSKLKVFDNLTCFFAIHYFFKNNKYLENLYNNVNKSLKVGGFFICTFMDEKNVLTLLNNEANYNSNVFSLKRNKEKVKVMLKGTKYFTNASSEFLVNTARMMKTFSNFALVERKDFDSYRQTFPTEFGMMSKEEKKFSNLNITFVLQKKM
tara:strand:- start:6401 stop:8704 length:2304 start_codon:yes stop_codon:yes gene_type:complete